MSIPNEICYDILVNFTNLEDNFAISKEIEIGRNIKINAIKIINKYIYKYILNFRIYMDINYYDVPKIVFKKYYPLIYRKNMILSVLKMVHNESRDYQKQLYDDILINPNHLVLNFNKIIDSMEIHELAYIGW